MYCLFRGILQHRKIVIILFFLLAVVGLIMMLGVPVNYNMVDYLPEEAQSTKALNILNDEFSQAIPNARVMLKDVSIQEAIWYKQQLMEIDGVSGVMWLDDVVDVKTPLQMADQATVEGYYKDGNALISLTIRDGDEVEITQKIYDVIGETNCLSGDGLDMAVAQTMSTSETTKAMLILVPIILLILFLSTSSYIEPLFFLAAIGISVAINMGTNLFFGEVSFVTQAVSPILQLAVSLDYAIFLLHSFESYRKQVPDPKEAMILAMKKSMPTIMASAATTLFGFLALLFMDFSIGVDLGMSLAKGIVLSFICVMIFLPAFTLGCYRLIDKTKHKSLMPKFHKVGGFIRKIKIPCIILVLLLLVPCYLAQGQNSFTYGMSEASLALERSREDIEQINQEFGQSTQMVLLLPGHDVARESQLSQELMDIPNVDQVISYSTMVGAQIPPEYLSESQRSQFLSENYSRVILYLNTPVEGEEAFSTVQQVQNTAQKYYDDQVYSCGQSVNLYDTKNVVTQDNQLVSLIAMIAIAAVLLLTFRSITLPILLLLTIEMAIWMNLSIPYFEGSAICYIGYLVINTVQLGATVDYAILLTKHYMDNRKTLGKREAMGKTLQETCGSILVSALILAASGFCLGYTSTNSVISQLGMLLGRGAVLSMVLVICLLPNLLIIFDKVVQKTTWRAKFYKEGKK